MPAGRVSYIYTFFYMKPVLFLLSLTASALLVQHVSSKKSAAPIRADQSSTADEWLYQQKAFPYDRPDRVAQRQAVADRLQQRNQMLMQKTEDVDDWHFIGPITIGGRILDIVCPVGDDNTIYVGTASGGVLKSTNGGDSWANIFDAQSTLSIGDLAIDPNESNVIYVGTGEPGNGVGSVTYDGNGIYRSNDAGITWTNIGLTNGGNTGRIAINPQNTDIIFTAMLGDLFENTPDRGIYRTEDGGTTWEKVLYVNDSTGGIDVCINPENPDIVYAATWERVRRYNRRDYAGQGSRVYRSEDGGDTWEMLTNGLPAGTQELSKISIAVAPSNPDYVYATVVGSNDKLKDIYKSIDGGDTWIALNCTAEVTTTSQDNWFGGVRINPNDENEIYWVGFYVSRSTDGGLNWTTITEDAHVDCHALYISPTDDNFRIMGSDGGLFFTYNDFISYTFEQNIPVTQLYTLDVYPGDTSRLIGGAQDNGSFARDAGGDWAFVNWGDGVSTRFVPVDESSFYGNYQYGGYYGIVGGNYMDLFGFDFDERFNWRSPMELNPLNPQTIYFGGNTIYRTTNYGESVSQISGDLTDGSQGIGLTFGSIFTIHNAPADTNYIYVGTDDANVWRSDDYGDTWTSITDGLPYRYCMSIETHPDNAQQAFVAFSGFRWAEDIAHIYMSENAGDTWTPIDGDLPDIPVNDIQVFTIGDTTGLAIATDVGCYYSYDLGEHWFALGAAMPIVSVYEIYYDAETYTLFAGTYGRGAWKIEMPRAEPIVQSATQYTDVTLTLWPNPASDKANLHFNRKVADVDISILTMSGEVVFQTTYSGVRDVSIPVADLPQGTYMVVAEWEGKRMVTQMVHI